MRKVYLLAWLFLSTPCFATSWPGFRDMYADSMTTVPFQNTVKQAYGTAWTDTQFGNKYTRVAGDSLTSIPGIGTWGRLARHHYSKREPWNATGSKILIKQALSGAPTKLLLNGSSPYAAASNICGASVLWDYRWAPDSTLGWDLVNVSQYGDTLSWWRVVPDTPGCMTLALVQKQQLVPPIKKSAGILEGYGIGRGEGNIGKGSNGTYYIAAIDSTVMGFHRAWILSLTPTSVIQTPTKYILPSGPSGANCPFGLGDTCDVVSNYSISPLANFVYVHYTGRTTGTQDATLILATDLNAQKVKALTYPVRTDSCQGCPAPQTKGWIYPMKHADMVVGADGLSEYLVGGRSCPSEPTARGHVVRANLGDGSTFFLTRGAGGGTVNEASVWGVSARNIRRPGWVYVTYSNNGTLRFSDEIVSIKVDGTDSTQIQRWGRTHTQASTYDYEAQAVPSLDGKRVMIASNWALNCGAGCGSVTNPQSYVISADSSSGGFFPAKDIYTRPVDWAILDRTLASSRIYNVRGQLVKNPKATGVYFRKSVYRSGRVKTERVVIVK